MKKFLIVFFIIGIIFRLWIAALIPQPFVFDQAEYRYFALQMLNHGLFAWSARLYGYPLFLAAVYKFFGQDNFAALSVIQAILDSLTAVMVYLAAKKLFKNQKISVISFLLYLFNPFTSVYVILTLSETWAIFLTTLIIYFLVLMITEKKTRLVFILSLLLGYLPQVRPSFIFFSILLYFVLLGWSLKIEVTGRKISTAILCVFLFLLPFTYNILGNWVYFHQFSATTVDNLFVREFYISLYVPGRSPIHAKDPSVFPKEVRTIYGEYSSVPKNSRQRYAMTQKYLKPGLQKAANDPGAFVLSRLAKFWYVWEKHFLFYYTQSENAYTDFLTYWGNNLLLFFGLFGFIIWQRSVKEKYFWFKIFVVFTVLYISVVHSFSLAEERYSLPGYPLVFLFAGYGVYELANKFFRLCNSHSV